MIEKYHFFFKPYDCNFMMTVTWKSIPNSPSKSIGGLTSIEIRYDNFTSFYNPFILLFIQVVVFDLSINKYEPICDQFSKSINFIIQRFHNSISEAKTRDCSNFSCLFT